MFPITSLILLTFCIWVVCCEYQEAPYATWAHSHVVWINGREQNQSKVIAMVDQYLARNISVGGVLIDSAWSKTFNDYVWDNKKFPNPKDMIDYFHSKDIRVILWTTSLVNNDSSIYEEGKKNKYFLNNGKLAHWWHGNGAFIDYLNPAARNWWHKQLDKVIDIGVDGWKCDGADPIIALLRPWPYSPSAKRYVGLHQYGHWYYGDFYNYTKSRNPEALIMARPTDTFQTVTSWNYAPKYVMFSGWVGDQDSSSQGLQKAMYNILKSAWNGYLNYGFDIGGYRGQSISKNIFLRWVQTGALLPFMQNGGNGRHFPWVFDEETVQIYRKYVNIHYSLQPYFLTVATKNYAAKKSSLTPIADKIAQDSTKLPEVYGYLLGDSMLIYPIFEQNGQANVKFPSGSNWIYYFNSKKVYPGSLNTYFTFQINESPIFLKSNSVIPMASQIVVVAVQPGFRLTESFIYGQYSDDFSLQFDGNLFKIEINRFFKNDEIKQKHENNNMVNLRLIGFQKEGSQSLMIENEQVIKMQVNTGVQYFGKYSLISEYKYQPVEMEIASQ